MKRKRKPRPRVGLLAAFACFALTAPGPATRVAAGGPSPGDPVVLNDDGGWCWFQDERALVVGHTLIVGSVAAGRHDPDRLGAVELTTVDLATGATTRLRSPFERMGESWRSTQGTGGRTARPRRSRHHLHLDQRPSGDRGPPLKRRRPPTLGDLPRPSER